MSEVQIGDDILAWIKTAAMSDYVVVDGQGTWTVNRSQTKISTASKNKRGYNTSTYGNMEVTIDLDINPTLPDAGFVALEGVCITKPSASFQVQLRRNGMDGVDADKIFECAVKGSMPSTTGPLDDKVSTKFQFAIADRPTVDKLGFA